MNDKRSYTKINSDGSRSIYSYASKKKYNSKIKKYTIHFSLSDDDQSIVNFLENEREELGMSSNAYIKKILVDYVNDKYK